MTCQHKWVRCRKLMQDISYSQLSSQEDCMGLFRRDDQSTHDHKNLLQGLKPQTYIIQFHQRNEIAQAIKRDTIFRFRHIWCKNRAFSLRNWFLKLKYKSNWISFAYKLYYSSAMISGLQCKISPWDGSNPLPKEIAFVHNCWPHAPIVFKHDSKWP